MGQAKQRKATQPDYGYPAIFVMQLFDADDNELADINLTIRRRSRSLMTQHDAIAMAGIIATYYRTPSDHNWAAVETAIAKYCRPLDVQPNLEAIKAIAGILPTAFWGWVRETVVNEQGDRVMGEVLESRDPNTGAKCQRTFESVLGTAPKQENATMREFQGAVFEQQLLEAAR